MFRDTAGCKIPFNVTGVNIYFYLISHPIDSEIIVTSCLSALIWTRKTEEASAKLVIRRSRSLKLMAIAVALLLLSCSAVTREKDKQKGQNESKMS